MSAISANRWRSLGLPLGVLLIFALLMGIIAARALAPYTDQEYSLPWHQAVWLSAEEKSSVVYFRRSLNLERLLHTAYVQLSATDGFEFYVNGNLIGKQVFTSLRPTAIYDIARYLHKGVNTLAVKAQRMSRGGPVEMIMLGHLVDAAGQLQMLPSNRSWRVNVLEENQRIGAVSWKDEEFDDGHWPRAVVARIADAARAYPVAVPPEVFQLFPRGQWIRSSLQHQKRVVLRRSFELPLEDGKIDWAWMGVAANADTEVTANGVLLSSIEQDLPFMPAFNIAPYLKSGHNEVLVSLAGCPSDCEAVISGLASLPVGMVDFSSSPKWENRVPGPAGQTARWQPVLAMAHMQPVPLSKSVPTGKPVIVVGKARLVRPLFLQRTQEVTAYAMGILALTGVGFGLFVAGSGRAGRTEWRNLLAIYSMPFVVATVLLVGLLLVRYDPRIEDSFVFSFGVLAAIVALILIWECAILLEMRFKGMDHETLRNMLLGTPRLAVEDVTQGSQTRELPPLNFAPAGWHATATARQSQATNPTSPRAAPDIVPSASANAAGSGYTATKFSLSRNAVALLLVAAAGLVLAFSLISLDRDNTPPSEIAMIDPVDQQQAPLDPPTELAATRDAVDTVITAVEESPSQAIQRSAADGIAEADVAEVDVAEDSAQTGQDTPPVSQQLDEAQPQTGVLTADASSEETESTGIDQTSDAVAPPVTESSVEQAPAPVSQPTADASLQTPGLVSEPDQSIEDAGSEAQQAAAVSASPVDEAPAQRSQAAVDEQMSRLSQRATERLASQLEEAEVKSAHREVAESTPVARKLAPAAPPTSQSGTSAVPPQVQPSVPKVAVSPPVQPSVPKVAAAPPPVQPSVPKVIAPAQVQPSVPKVAGAQPAQAVTPATKDKPLLSSQERLRAALLEGRWTSQGEPASLLPSDVTVCRDERTIIACWSVPRDIDTKYGAALYKVEATLQAFSADGSFDILYRTLVKLVAAPGGETAGAEASQADWQVSEHTTTCQLSQPDRVSCRDETGGVREYRH